MKILCNHCKHLFEVDAEKAGRVQYSKCESIFRVELVLKSPCPGCKSMLKVVTDAQKNNIGYLLEPTVAKKLDVQKPKAETKSVKTTASKPVIKKQVKTKKEEPVDDYEPVKEITLEDRVKLKLQKRLDSYHRYSIQGFKQQPKKNLHIANVLKIAQKTAQPRIYLSILTLLSLGLVFGMMKSVFQPDETMDIAQNRTAIEEGVEEYEPAHHDDAVGGPAFPSETDRKTGLEDETIKKINSNLQILHLPALKQVTSTYGIRLDPFTKKLAFHAGVDFKADLGTKIEAAMDGEVKYVGPRSMYGNTVILKHANGYETLYGHLSKIHVKQGQKIRQKDIIALAGSTGRSTGPHLHFELIKNGKKIDPLSAELLHAKK